ncbi:hypothetical protein T11_11485 [Trichinella zimbabwensis]|uniref:Uncharacterized protein n=1 Tax=Trichinella zimbabwensis TaxID=268475 RepID=A0A0V1I497_9BILA|nr:hypothetical protein T11_11485 [Trichinella zimbabwensis]
MILTQHALRLFRPNNVVTCETVFEYRLCSCFLLKPLSLEPDNPNLHRNPELLVGCDVRVTLEWRVNNVILTLLSLRRASDSAIPNCLAHSWIELENHQPDCSQHFRYAFHQTLPSIQKEITSSSVISGCLSAPSPNLQQVDVWISEIMVRNKGVFISSKILWMKRTGVLLLRKACKSTISNKYN